MYIANMDIKKVCGVAWPKDVATLAGQAPFEHVESEVEFTRCIHLGTVKTPAPWFNLAKYLWLMEGGQRLETEQDGLRIHLGKHPAAIVV